ncbi:uncharacterized protein LOC121425355 [Lytechinus variegatus]|uniref:uncharacterized protein LOC121425355 n=1 Tax=Lytechinus variegatus TaxID=7654 RepID=UPI001BB265DC|nr:uncharacterized protein LOC121425355 [Lytechinus variegatus]
MHEKSVEQGVLPEDWTSANVTPVFKKGSKSEGSNYRHLNELDQYHRRVNLEVAGVPERQGEVPERIVLNIAKHISPELAASDFDVVHRLGSKRQADNKARPIIVRFTTRRARNIMYDGRRKLKTLSTKDLGYNSDGKIYLNENLIASTKELMKDVNKARRDAGYKFLWTQNGRIYVRKDEKCQPIIIHSREDFSKL